VIVAGLENVTKRFGQIAALDRVSLAVREGEVVAVLGPNGAGKSTAIALLLGLRRPDDGRALLFGGDPRRPCSRRSVGAARQETAFPATLRVREVIDLVRAHFERPLPAAAVCDRFDLGGLASRQIGGLSGGERRRVGIALAFAGRPRLVVLDEPTAGLDPEARRSVWEAIRTHVGEGGAALLSTHHLEEAEALANRVVVIERGRVQADCPVAQIKAAARMTVVRFRAGPGVEVERAGRDGEYLRIVTADGEAEVERLVREGVPLAGLEVRPPTLEEALGAWRDGG
jgi:ABC-2 type transport system ATP-binding protein